MKTFARYTLYTAAGMLGLAFLAAIVLFCVMHFGETALTINFFDEDFDRSRIASLGPFEWIGVFLASVVGFFVAGVAGTFAIAFTGGVLIIVFASLAVMFAVGAAFLLLPLVVFVGAGWLIWRTVKKMRAPKMPVAA